MLCETLDGAAAIAVLCEGCFDFDGTTTPAVTAKVPNGIAPVCQACLALRTEASA